MNERDGMEQNWKSRWNGMGRKKEGTEWNENKHWMKNGIEWKSRRNITKRKMEWNDDDDKMELNTKKDGINKKRKRWWKKKKKDGMEWKERWMGSKRLNEI